MSEVSPMLATSVLDAANACLNGGTATVVLRSGREFVGKLEKPSLSLFSFGATIHMKTEPLGWVTIDLGEVVAVQVTR